MKKVLQFRSQLLLRQLAEFIGDGARRTARNGSITDRVPTDALAYLIDGAIGQSARDAGLRTWKPFLVGQTERQFELKPAMVIAMRHRDRQQRDERFAWMIRQHATYKVLGDLGEDRGCRDGGIERHRTGDRTQIGKADADRHRAAGP